VRVVGETRPFTAIGLAVALGALLDRACAVQRIG
jgi:hypothetical protein